MGTPPTEAEFLFLIADISGYTRFMMTNHTARVHAHGVISDLIAAVLKQVQLPLEVNKLEGDAIFLVAAKQDDGWPELGTTIGQRLHAFIDAFDAKVTELANSNICSCIACQQMVSLRLKLIGHYGVAVRSQMAGFDELSGVDVILLHRLLKNEVPSSEYILLTDAAFAFLQPPGSFTHHTERYDDVGEIALRLRAATPAIPSAAAVRFSLKDTLRKLSYDIRYAFAKKRHPAQ
ncbi:MAG: DUF2652 domain-containing protein [Pirellulales bacterium]|nr:DUF2652 domain-containing protein [Pirellulales bacterium]